MGYGAGGGGRTGDTRALGGRFQMTPAIFQGEGEGKTIATEANVRDIVKFAEYHGEQANVGGTKDTLTSKQREERDRLGMLTKAMWDFTNQRYVDHKNDIQQITWKIADDGTLRVKANASLGDINKFIKANNKEFNTLLAQLQGSNKGGAATKAEKKITDLMAKFLGRVTLPVRGQIFAETHNQLSGIRDKHQEIRNLISKGDWQGVKNFKLTKETQWAKAYKETADKMYKDIRQGKAREKKETTVQKKMDILNSWRKSGSDRPKALSLAKIDANIARLTSQMADTKARARGLGVVLDTKGVTTFKAATTQHVRNLVNSFRKSTGLKLSTSSVINELKKETQKYRGRKV
jgi:hypothetical protein